MKKHNKYVLNSLMTLLLLLSSQFSLATTYNLSNFTNFYSIGGFATPTNAEISLETTQLGVFTTEAEIENFFNSAIYSAALFDGTTLIASTNDTKSYWDLEFNFKDGQTAEPVFATLVATSTELTLSFLTPNETTSARLVAWDANSGNPLNVQYFQVNNIDDQTLSYLDFSAFSGSFADVGYGNSFVFSSVNSPSAVPLPPTALLFASSLMGYLGFTRRKTI